VYTCTREQQIRACIHNRSFTAHTYTHIHLYFAVTRFASDSDDADALAQCSSRHTMSVRARARARSVSPPRGRQNASSLAFARDTHRPISRCWFGIVAFKARRIHKWPAATETMVLAVSKKNIYVCFQRMYKRPNNRQTDQPTGRGNLN